jgi:hypothetical protein
MLKELYESLKAELEAASIDKGTEIADKVGEVIYGFFTPDNE